MTVRRRSGSADQEDVSSEVSRENLVSFNSVNAPSSVDGQSQAQIDVSVNNSATVALITDPDHCTTGLSNGYQIDVELRVNGVVKDTNTLCVGVLGTKTTTLSWTALSSGTKSLEITAVGSNSGNQLEQWTGTITVRDAFDDGSDGGTDGGGSGDCPSGTVWDPETGRCVSSSSGPAGWFRQLESGEQVALVLGGAGVLVALSRGGR